MLISSRRLGLSRLIERWLASKNMRRKVFRSLSRQGYHVHREFGDHSFIYDPSEAIGKMLDDYGDVNRAETVDIIRRGLAAAGRDSGGVYLELGANIGTQAIYAGLAFDFDRLMAVEPDPDTFKVLDMNVRINGLSERTQVFDVAVSDAAGTAQLQRSRRNTGVSTLRTHALDEINARPGGPDTLDSVDVRLVRGDDLIAENGVAPQDIAMLWIDVEGFEPQALAGMPQILSHKPPMFIEYTPAWLTGDERALIENALFDTYATVSVHQEGGRQIDRDGFRALEKQFDLFALP